MPEPKQAPRDLKHETAEQVIPLVEETARVDTRAVVRGKVRIRTETDTVEEIARAALDTETVEVTRVPIDREVDTPPAVRTENDVVIVPVLEEVLVIEKRLVLKEELHIRRRIATETIEQPVTLRKQRAVVEHLDPSDPEAPNSKEPPS
jgi:stress response protein YsnF